MSKGWTLVTGATGFVGHQLVRELIDRGERVKALVRAGSNLRYLRGYPADRLQLAYGDIRIGRTVYQALAGCDRMYHVAAVFRMWSPDPASIIDPAVDGTRETLEAARARQLDKIVVTSSVASLGATASESEVMDEDHPFNIQDPEVYIQAKYEAEQVARELAKELPIVIVNPTGISGPADWKPTPTGEGILEYLTWTPLMRFPITPAGVNLVDVADVVQGHILAMEKGRVGERYILGGENVTYSQMFTTLSEITGLPAPADKPTSRGLASFAATLLELGARMSGGEPKVTRKLIRDYAYAYVFVTSKKAERELGYTHRPAKETLTRAVRWYLAHGYVPPKAAARLRLELRG